MAIATQSCDSGCRLSIIVPTYCEAESLPILVKRTAETLASAQTSFEIIVVDDNSPDGTEQVCLDLSNDYPVQALVRRRERGLSSAVIHGMNHAHGAILVVMDADLSHPPEKIPELVESLDDDRVDFVIGSRYVPGGSTDADWGLFRWINSRLATLLAVPLTSAKDPMAGFFAIRRSTFQSCSKLDPIGYKIGLELIVKCRCRSIREVPISFQDRRHGESKLSFKEQVNYLRHLKRLYEFKLGALGEPLKFLAIGASGIVVDLIFFWFLLMAMQPQLARGLAIGVAMTWNFAWNRRLTFAGARSRPLFPQYVRFCLSCVLGAAVNWSIFAGLHASSGFFAARPLLAALIGIMGGFLSNFLLSKHFAFRVRPSRRFLASTSDEADRK